MNIQETVNEIMESAKLKIALATGNQCAVAMHVISFNEQGQPLGIFTAATFAPNVQSIMPLIGSLVQSVVNQGAPINGRSN